MSALILKADIHERGRHVCFVPIADTHHSILTPTFPAMERMKKQAAREAACIDVSQLSAYLSDALLGICFSRARRLRWQLKHRCLLTLTQCCQENNPPIRKFKRIVVLHRFVLVHLSEDCRRVA
jgi:hypothetical protein